ncbi:hypothetical protein SDC9_44405 [bioreactor metagenome]|uniref:DUF4252 domain-containing protein n=1 Tax=bioreactor metagenome TaxID=1076179 RepID=A0A644W398_9ZZZZ|nr:DUF4252 domain-containing protein [Paludibacter sp.]
MKKTILLLVSLLFTAITIQAQSLQKFYDKYADDERFQYVSINRGMINLGSIVSGISKSDQKNLSKLNGLKILTLEAASESAIMRNTIREIEQIVSNGKFESAVEVRDKGERVNIYYRVTGNDNADMLIITKEQNEFNCIWITGKMTKEEMMDTFSSQNIQGKPLAVVSSATFLLMI